MYFLFYTFENELYQSLYFCIGMKGFVYEHINDNPYRQAYKNISIVSVLTQMIVEIKIDAHNVNFH